MKLIQLLGILLFGFATAIAQRPAMITDIRDWPIMDNNVKLTADGRFAMLKVAQDTGGYRYKIINLKNTSQNDLGSISEGLFTNDSKSFIYQRGDSLLRFNLTEKKSELIAIVKTADFINNENGDQYVLFRRAEIASLFIYSTCNKHTTQIPNISSFRYIAKLHAFLLEHKSGQNLRLLSPLAGTDRSIWQGGKFDSIMSFKIDPKEDKVAILTKRAFDRGMLGLWLCDLGDGESAQFTDNLADLFKVTDQILPFFKFTADGKSIFFSCQKTAVPAHEDENTTGVKVWSYRDPVLLPKQENGLTNLETYWLSLNLANRFVVKFNVSDFLEMPDKVTGGHLVVTRNDNEPWWPFSLQQQVVISLADGSELALTNGWRTGVAFSYSPGGNYIVYFDRSLHNFMCYHIKTSQVTNLTYDLSESIEDDSKRTLNPAPADNIAAWDKFDRYLLLYDNFDVWRVNLRDTKKSLNLTNGFGKKNEIKLRLVDLGPVLDLTDSKERFLLTGFNVKNKFNGFLQTYIDRAQSPEILSMGPFLFYRQNSQIKDLTSFDNGMPPLKARNANVWIVKRQTASEAPNYFISYDLKNFKQVTNFRPQKNLNWLTAELVSWMLPNGRLSQGILYKPQNFDPSKKYPVILNFYEKLSHRLYEFPYLGYSDDNINIPWFVSNNYLVFTPDIYSENAAKTGKPIGIWATESVLSAANTLAKMTFVDSNSMAIQGHSFGGLEAAFIATSSNKRFAAAMEAAGSTDPVSRYLTLIRFDSAKENTSMQTSMETQHELYGASLWEKPLLYLKGSAVLNADKVEIPMLIMHNEKDNQVQWHQGLEFYMALRRLKKRVWLLQYDNQEHSLYGEDARDYTIRMTQFFDHYLKGAPAPVWMTKGIPAKEKQFKSGYELDPGVEP